MAIATITIATSAAAGGTTQAPVTVSSVPPAVPTQGSLWWNQDLGKLFMYYADANSSQWVMVGV